MSLSSSFYKSFYSPQKLGHMLHEEIANHSHYSSAARRFLVNDKKIADLIEAGADLTVKNHYQLTPFMAAINERLSHIAQKIFEKDRNVLHDRCDRNHSWTALHSLISHQDCEELKKWLDAGLDPNAKYDQQSSISYALSVTEYEDIIGILASHPTMDINAQNDLGETTLVHFIKKHRHDYWIPHINFLLDLKNIDVSARDNMGFDAEHYARENKFIDLADRILLMKGNPEAEKKKEFSDYRQRGLPTKAPLRTCKLTIKTAQNKVF